LFFLALPQKEPKRSSLLKPIGPRKPKFPPIPQGHDSRPFWLSANAGPESRQGHRASHIVNLVLLHWLALNQEIVKIFKYRYKVLNMVSHQPNPVKKIKMSFVKKSELFERSEFSDFRKIF
jgi:hypothetical protein